MPVMAGTDNNKRWSGRVTRESSALDLEEGVFTWSDPKEIARSLQRSAESSKHRKSPSFRSAMSMLVFLSIAREKIWTTIGLRCSNRPRLNCESYMVGNRVELFNL